MKTPVPLLFVIISLFLGGTSTTYAQSQTGNTSDISVSRNVSATRYSNEGEPTVIITITINKNTTRGHAMLEEDFSSDLVANVVESEDASFQSQNGKAEFEWSAIPADRAVTVSYELKVTKKTTDDQTVSGQLSYLNQIFPIPPTSFSLKVVIPDSIARAKPTNAIPPTLSSNITTSGDLIYRIQIAAIAVGDKSKVPALLKQYNITDEPYLEAASANIIRVMIDSFPNLSLAETRIGELKRKGLTGAYAVPYYKGKRITLREAAMYTQQ